MRGTSSTSLTSVAIVRRLLFCGLAIFVCLPAGAQQTDINRYTVYTGFDYMISPARNLTERRFDADFGVTCTLGNSIISGEGTIKGTETTYVPLLTSAGVPPSSVLVPFKSTTYTFAAGPQFYLRKWQRVNFLGRPGLGGIHESADLTFPPQLPLLFQALQVPIPSSHQTDTTWFVGLGGGFDVNVSRRVGIRFTADWINTHLFSNLLTDRQNYVRFTAGEVCSSNSDENMQRKSPFLRLSRGGT
jgi:hypothetical protein